MFICTGDGMPSQNPLEEELQGEGWVADGEDRMPMVGEIPTVHASNPPVMG